MEKVHARTERNTEANAISTFCRQEGIVKATLHSRFTFGSWMDVLPIRDQVNIAYGFPERHAEVKALLNNLHEAQSKQLETLASSESTARMAANEARIHHHEQVMAVQNMTTEVVGALHFLEHSIGGYLDGIRIVLAAIDDNLAKMLSVLKAPLGTKSAELTQDGCRALNRGFVQEAKQSFEAALQHKPSDHVALSLLGLVSLHEDNLKTAVEAFRKAVAYVPSDRGQSELAIALENLARAYYVSGDFDEAYEYSKRAQNLGISRPKVSCYRHCRVSA